MGNFLLAKAKKIQFLCFYGRDHSGEYAIQEADTIRYHQMPPRVIDREMYDICFSIIEQFVEL